MNSKDISRLRAAAINAVGRTATFEALIHETRQAGSILRIPAEDVEREINLAVIRGQESLETSPGYEVEKLPLEWARRTT